MKEDIKKEIILHMQKKYKSDGHPFSELIFFRFEGFINKVADDFIKIPIEHFTSDLEKGIEEQKIFKRECQNHKENCQNCKFWEILDKTKKNFLG